MIDYSLLLGIHKKDQGSKETYEKVHLMEETNSLLVIETSEFVIYAGIVDILTYYGAKKRAETLFSGTLRCGRDCSCQPPSKYASRFLRFFTAHSRVDPSAKLRFHQVKSDGKK